MVRPASFGFNPESAQTNHFTSNGNHGTADDAAIAQVEFDGLVRVLERAGCEVVIVQDSHHPAKPDAVFSNNWLSLHGDGTAIAYPLATASRRPERRIEAVSKALEEARFAVGPWIDLAPLEDEGVFLEGTGSLVLDRLNDAAYACLSDRTHLRALARFADVTSHAVVAFGASDPSGRPIYHTNVALCLGTRFALVCSEVVHSSDFDGLRTSIEATNREIIDLSFEQITGFAANALELRNRTGETFVAMSSSAHRHLTAAQRRRLASLGGELVFADIPTIERLGGGSARCCLTEIHLPRRQTNSLSAC